MSGIPASPIDGGAFVAVVGRSGAGKDSVISFSRAALVGEPRIHFVRRCITRPTDGVHEDHEPAGEADFAARAAAGGFALAWAAHGHRYGIPAEVDGIVGAGGIAVANLSRTVLHDMRQRYVNAFTVEVTASPEVLAARVAGRGREEGAAVEKRLARAVDYDRSRGIVEIDNSGPLDVAGGAFVDLLRRILAETSGTPPADHSMARTAS